jgi:hypothetical protein
MRAALFILSALCVGVAIMPTPPASTFLAPVVPPACSASAPLRSAATGELADLLLDGIIAFDAAATAAIRTARGDDAVPSDALLLLADAFDKQAASFDALSVEADRELAQRRADAFDAAAATLRHAPRDCARSQRRRRPPLRMTTGRTRSTCDFTHLSGSPHWAALARGRS